MKLTFDTKTVQQLREHALYAKEHKPLWGQPETAVPGLWLVGDQGVYLMSNGSPGLLKSVSPEKHLVAYAKQCNPEKMDFDAWWDAKRRSFGGDDGVEFIPLSSIPPSGRIAIDINAKGMTILEMV